ncbi:MAG: pyridoxal phosphate-dependent aminotransferase [Clostridiales bacterium]|jgi:cystathionine beta-lyase|nr:pyridoxal phosphate-dependent aminotransferase [Clostridiales bacterium]
MYNFDEVINRYNTNSLKYDFASQRGKPEGILPLWVADMDFRTPGEVTDALVKCCEHGIFGYTETKGDYFEAVFNWFDSRFGYKFNEGWLVKTPGIVFAISAAINSFTEKGDAVLIQRPVYYPFFGSIMANGRKVVSNSLIYENGAYRIDFEDFEQKIIAEKVKLFIFCSPHNPVGRVWTRDEIKKIGDICLKHNCIVVSDEIHCDFVYAPHKHTVFTQACEGFEQNSVVCTAPSKTFNLAGLQVSNIFIPDRKLREKFIGAVLRTGYSQLNTLGLAACVAAYKYGAPWLDALLNYLSGNAAFINNFLRENMPRVKLIKPEGTYLAWFNFKGLNMPQKELDDVITHKANLWLDSGTMFGTEGEGFQRINFACARSVLAAALAALAEGFNE